LNLLLGNLPFLRRHYMNAESRLYPAHEFDHLLKMYNPDLVVTGTPGFNIHDVHVLRSSRRLGIPTATVMLSWDNLTSKGFMNGVPEYLLVWSRLMAETMISHARGFTRPAQPNSTTTIGLERQLTSHNGETCMMFRAMPF
jgi:hypothetical protein